MCQYWPLLAERGWTVSFRKTAAYRNVRYLLLFWFNYPLELAILVERRIATVDSLFVNAMPRPAFGNEYAGNRNGSAGDNSRNKSCNKIFNIHLPPSLSIATRLFADRILLRRS